MILVTFAVPFESAAFRRRAVSREVRIVHTGVGAEAARVALELALCREVPERVIASGFAGALAPEFRVGDILSDGEDPKWLRARFASAPEVLVDAEAKRHFRARTGAEAVDMESDAIREICTVVGVPMMILRAVSDGAEDDLGLPPDLLAALTDRPVRTFPRLVRTLLSDGARRKAFLRLVRDCRSAQLSLANALERELSGHPVT